MVNNWKAAEELQRFTELFVDPSNKRVMDAKKILDDPNYKWKKGEKVRATEKYKRLEGENINLNSMKSAVRELIDDHEAQTDMLTEIYAEWYKKIATDGAQPLEIMSRQYDIIQTMWARIYAAIKPLDLDLDPPKKIESDGKHK